METTAIQTLRLSESLALPRALVTHVVGILAMRGKGKSYTAFVLMEEMVSQGLFVGFVDPLGIAWGIRSSADGKREGLPVIVFGGRRGDVPLDPTAGKLVAQAVLELRQPYILDLSLFDTEDQQRTFLADFIEGFRIPEQVLMHLIVDEADLFAPQIPQSTEARRSLHALHALVRRFRFKGMGATIISQRPAELAKGILQLDVLIALGMTTPQDIKALDEWIKRNATETERQTFLSTLATLPVGEAWIWSPQWLQLFERVKIRSRQTFDSSRTPDVDGALTVPARLTELDLSQISTQIADLMAQSQETDPALLRQRIRALEEQLRSRSQAGQVARSLPTQSWRQELALARRQLVEKDQEIQRLQRQLAEFSRLQVEVSGTTVPLVEMPAYLQRLHIEQAIITVDQLNSMPQTKAKLDGEAVLSKPEPTQKVQPKKPLTVNDVFALLPHSQMITLKNLLKKVEALTTNERALFSWLLSNDGSGLRPLDLADAVCINVRATRPDRTSELRRIPFIHHPANTGSYFASVFAEYASKAFPGISAETLQIVKHCLLDAAR